MVSAEKLVKIKKFPTIFNPKNAWSIKGSENRQEPRYTVEEKPIHEGSMGSIYRAWDDTKGQLVAVKVLYDSVQKDENYASMIEREARTMANINHPGIPRVYDFTFADTPEGSLEPVMIMEYIKEENLQQRLKSKIPLQPEEVIRIVGQVASVIDYIDQEHKLYHGDIKPSQILLCEPHVKVVDFGTSTAVSLAGNEYTPEFSAPERQLKKIRNLATEEFSLAATAYNMITGRVVDLDPFKPTAKFKRLSKWNLKYDFSESDITMLNKLFEKALAYKPEERYESSSEFAESFANTMVNAKIRKRSFFTL